MTADAAPALPRLRAGLDLQQVGSVGAPRWTLHDPLRGRYHRLGWVEAELLSRFAGNDAQGVLAQVRRDTPLDPDPDTLATLLSWLHSEQLIEADGPDALERLASAGAAQRRSAWSSAFRFTLYAKRRLLNPERLLQRIDAALSPLVERPRLAVALLAMWVLALVFALPGHGSDLADTLGAHLNPTGLALFLLTLVFTNVVHEFGHGIVATRLGCRVRAMGVALIFLIPVAWCDSSDAWRLPRRRDRLLIDAGGLAMEALLAMVALGCWLLLPDGLLRSIAFFVAVSSLLTTLLINLNPFMKFDGYYLLADALGVENLQARAFAALRWRLRRTLFGTDAPAPDTIMGQRRAVLYAYAAGTWVYRLFLYLAIGWLVYTFWFKALGVVLAIATLHLLLVKPVATELAWALGDARRRGVRGRRLATTALLLALLALMLLPLPRSIEAPAMLVPTRSAQLFTPQPARVAALHVGRGDAVQRGDVVLTLEDPALSHRLTRALAEREALLESLRASSADTLIEVPAAFRPARTRGAATGANDARSALASGAAQLAEHDARIAAAQRALDALTLRAPIDGVVVDIDESLQPGRWLAANAVALRLASTGQARVRAYLTSLDAERLAPFAADRPTARFRSLDGSVDRTVRLESLERAGVDALVDAALAVPHGGPIAVQAPRRDVRDTQSAPLPPIGNRHLALLGVQEDLQLVGERPGYVRLSGEPVSLARRAAVRVYGALVRESGF